MKKNKGFTLIELLAIIVILAIIAVITVPIILNVIDNSKKAAAQDSAYGYKDSINKYYVSKLANNPNYELADGTYSVGDLDVTSEGKMPGSNSWVTIANSSVTDGCLQFDEYKVEITNGEVKDAVNGECAINEYVPLTGEVLSNIESYDTMEIVYYNPIDGVMCEDYALNNSIPEYKGVVPEINELGQTGCLKWYKYSTNIDGSINMILDHNIEVRKQYYSNSDNTYGPSNLMQYLTLSEWEKVPTRNDKYTAYIDDGTTKTVKFTNATDTDNAVIYTGKKARLITVQEVAEITNTPKNEQSPAPNFAFYLDGSQRSSLNQSDYYWLFENTKDCEQYGCGKQYQEISLGNYGYWTSSPCAGNSSGAWTVGRNGGIEGGAVTNSYGVRPVITIPVP